MPGDDARREFLVRLAEALGSRWTATYEAVRAHGVLGATLRREGVEGHVVVVPSSVDRNVVTWQPFPSAGTAHYDIRTHGGELLRACSCEQAVAMLEGWCSSRGRVEPLPPVPMLAKMRPYLEAIARAELPRVEDAIDATSFALTPEGAAELDAAREALDPMALGRAFPRDDQGRLALDCAVLLAPLASRAKLGPGRRVFLSARSPRRRGDGDKLTLELGDAIEANAPHRWMNATWLWRRLAEPPPLPASATACAGLLDAGRFREALALFDVELTAAAERVLDGAPMSVHDAHLAPPWRVAMRRALWTLAPWSLRQQPAGRLALLPHQHQQRKAWIAWTGRAIDVERTGSNARLAMVAWKRTVDFDLGRLGITRRASAPGPVVAMPREARPTAISLAQALAGKALWKTTRALDLAKARPQREAVAELLAIARHGTSIDRANALWVLGAVATDEDGPAIEPFLDDGDETVRRAAIEAVKRAGHAGAVPKLAGMVNAPTGGVAVEAATAMRALSGKRGASATIAYLDHPDPKVREAACRASSFFQEGHKLVARHLERCARDPDPGVAAAASRALAKLAKR